MTLIPESAHRAAAHAEGSAWLLVDVGAGPEDGRVLDVGPRVAALLETDRAHLLGRRLTDVVAEHSRQSALALLTEDVDPTDEGPDASPPMQPVEFALSSGAVICTLSARRLRGSDGRPLVLLSFEENDERRRWEALRLGIVLSGESLWVFDEDHDVFHWLEGESPFSALGPGRSVERAKVFPRVHPDDRASLAQMFESLRTNNTDSDELLFRIADGAGGWRRLRSRARAVRFGFGGRRRVVGTTADTTPFLEQHEALRAAYASERKRGELVEQLSAAFIGASTEEELTEAVLHRVAPAFGGVGTLLAYVEGDHLRVAFGDEIDRALARTLDGLPLAAEKPLSYAVRTGEAQFIPSRDEYRRRWPAAHSLLDATEARSFAMVPLRAAGRALGAWVITYHERDGAAEQDRTLMRTLGTLAGQALERIRLQEARIELARIVQRNMLPETLPEVPGVELQALYHPAQTGLDVGGDWYDVVPLQNGGAAFVIGDVQGHDLHAAGLMGQVRTALRAYTWQDPEPGKVLARTNDLLIQMGVRAFTTCLYVLLTPDGRLLTARAGHPPMVQLSAGGEVAVRDEEPGPPLGIVEGATYPVWEYAFGESGILALLTDGVVEGPRCTAEEGLSRVGDLLADKGHEPLDLLAQYLMSTAGNTGHLDDSALLLVRRPPAR
ncbi:SpoIIE family protein phosphatase [Streptomyces sp. NPDC007088]|uniref:SpoIIE family protein phosphatase n=1 Tax=Streptomyces sp. NPDC007088 TaxID=3364773 RepID=UPI0036752C04